MDLSDSNVKESFFTFINDKKLSNGLTNQQLAGKLGWDERTVNRYLSNDGKDMPGTIPEIAYRDLLTAVSSNHEEFKVFFECRTERENTSNVQDNRGVDHITISNNIIMDSPFANKGNITIIKSDK